MRRRDQLEDEGTYKKKKGTELAESVGGEARVPASRDIPRSLAETVREGCLSLR